MNDQLAERIAIALEQLVLELAERNELRAGHTLEQARGLFPAIEASRDTQPTQPFPPIGGGWVCPVHQQVKTVPAGVSHKQCGPDHTDPSTGEASCKDYKAFLACATPGCQQKPPRAQNRAVVPNGLPRGDVLP
jgi:hypothetical protein